MLGGFSTASFWLCALCKKQRGCLSRSWKGVGSKDYRNNWAEYGKSVYSDSEATRFCRLNVLTYFHRLISLKLWLSLLVFRNLCSNITFPFNNLLDHVEDTISNNNWNKKKLFGETVWVSFLDNMLTKKI